MKRSHVFLLAVVAILIGALLVTLQDASVYATFDMAQKQQPETVTVVAKLDLDAPLHFDPKTTLLSLLLPWTKKESVQGSFTISPNPQILSAAKKLRSRDMPQTLPLLPQIFL